MTNITAVGIATTTTGFQVTVSGVYSMVAQISWAAGAGVSSQTTVGVNLQVSHDGGSTWVILAFSNAYSIPTAAGGSGHGVVVVVADGVELVSGDILRFNAQASPTSSTFDISNNETFFRVSMKQRSET